MQMYHTESGNKSITSINAMLMQKKDTSVLLSNDSNVPLYRQFEDLILHLIASGDLKEGDMLPSEIELARMHGIHQGTVRKAILNLTDKGILYRKQGRGTFVVFQKSNADRYKNYRFSASEDENCEPVNLSLLNLKVIKADQELADKMKLKKGAKLIELERFGMIGDRSYLHTVSYLPKSMYPGFEKLTPEDFIKNPFWKLQEIIFKIKIKKRNEFINAILADGPLAGRFDTEPGAPLLQVKMKATTETGDVCEYRISHCKTGDLTFHVSH